MDNLHYDAFISYRHSKNDMFIAKSIQKRLENFKVPKSVLSKVTNGKTKIERVFRDQDELPLSENLSEPIDIALSNSDYLIVICTPRLPESRWCLKEIETFTRLHGRDHILLILAEGEPRDSFPPILTREQVQVMYPDGSVGYEMREVEPLAADVRGKNARETAKLLDDATLRLAAVIFGLNYDDLKQRHREQKMKKGLMAAGGIAAAMFAFGMVAFGMMLTINSQKETISAQYDEIEEKLNTIENQKQVISDQYDEIQDKYTDAMVIAAEELARNGRRRDALYALVNANEGREIKPAVERELVELLNVYNPLGSRVPYSTFEINEKPREYVVADQRPMIAIKGNHDRIYIFNTDTQERLKIIEVPNGVSGLNSKTMAFLGEKTFFYIDGFKLHMVNVDNWSDIVIADNADCFVAVGKSKYLLMVCDGIMTAYTESGAVAYTIDMRVTDGADDIYSAFLVNQCVVSDSGSTLAILIQKDISNEYLFVINIETGSVKTSFEVSNDAGTKILLAGNMIYINHPGTYENDYNDKHFEAINIDTHESKFDKKYDLSLIDKIDYCEGVLAVNDYKEVRIIDAATGDIINSTDIDESIIDIKMMSPDIVDVFTVSGNVYRVNFSIDLYYDTTSQYYVTKPDYTIGGISFYDDDIYIQAQNNGNITRYAGRFRGEMLNSEDVDPDLDEKIFGTKGECGELIENQITSDDSKYTLVEYSDRTFKIVDAKTGEDVGNIYDLRTELMDFRYIPDLSSYVVVGYSGMFILTEDFEVRAEIPYCKDIQNGYAICHLGSYYYKYKLHSIDEVMEEAKEAITGYIPSDDVKKKYGIR
ncbi:MAG: TIR domain-containing protein [Lachnospiraceae bacterium]|nr:TIR domain-containing protein [Lachnospiraceae bacterium]